MVSRSITDPSEKHRWDRLLLERSGPAASTERRALAVCLRAEVAHTGLWRIPRLKLSPEVTCSARYPLLTTLGFGPADCRAPLSIYEIAPGVFISSPP